MQGADLDGGGDALMGPSLIRVGFHMHIYGGGQDPDYLVRCVRTAVWSVVHGVFGLVCGGINGVKSAFLCAPKGFCYVALCFG